jgi:cysteine-rich repeat protein
VGYSEEGGRWAVMLARRKAECGNGLVEFEEECDDGNTEDEDCCSSVCTIELECECEQAYDSPASVCYM